MGVRDRAPGRSFGMRSRDSCMGVRDTEGGCFRTSVPRFSPEDFAVEANHTNVVSLRDGLISEGVGFRHLEPEGREPVDSVGDVAVVTALGGRESHSGSHRDHVREGVVDGGANLLEAFASVPVPGPG